MQELPKKLNQRLEQRILENAVRHLPGNTGLVDFSSNDYLGFATNETIYSDTFQLLLRAGIHHNGATGSRLLSGNHSLYTTLEEYLKSFHKSQSALVFNSGYTANIGFFATVPQRGDVVLYDEYIHASIRDGIKMGHAKNHKFKHNDLNDLKSKIEHLAQERSVAGYAVPQMNVYVVTESVFSMDGDSPDLKRIVKICETYGCFLIVDEAHAVGVYGAKGEGLVQHLDLQDRIFARILTFGKAMGCHGAVILGSAALKRYLVNYARSFIYTTAMSPHAIATIQSAYSYMGAATEEHRKQLQKKIAFFLKMVKKTGLEKHFITSSSAIQSCILPGNDNVRTVADKLIEKGFDVKPILSPTVAKNEERLRFCVHNFNSEEEIGLVLKLLYSYI